MLISNTWIAVMAGKIPENIGDEGRHLSINLQIILR